MSGSIIWHLHQPYFIPDTEIKDQVEASYRPLIDSHVTHDVRFSLNITGSLLSRLHDLTPDFVDRLKSIHNEGLVQILGSAYHHPVLPILPPTHQYKQIVRDLETKESIFGTRPNGFWPTELAWSHQLVPVLEQLNVEWTIVDSTAIAAGTSVPTWQPTEFAGHDVLEPDTTTAVSQRELRSSYQAYTGDHSVTVVPRDQSHSRALIDPEVGALYQSGDPEDIADTVGEEVESTSGRLVIGGDGERITNGTAHRYHRFLKHLTSSHPDQIDHINPHPTDSRFIPATSFQGGFSSWASTPEDYTYLLQLWQLQQTLARYRLVDSPDASAANHLRAAEEALLKAEDSSNVFWRYVPRTRQAGHDTLAEAKAHLAAHRGDHR